MKNNIKMTEYEILSLTDRILATFTELTNSTILATIDRIQDKGWNPNSFVGI